MTEGGATPRVTIDRQLIVDKALVLLRSEGLEQLTLRRLAADLGVSATAVYRHLRAKDELLELVVDSIYMTIELPSPTGRWDSRLANLALSSREVFGRFPGLGIHLLTRTGRAPAKGARRWTDAAVLPLLEAGFEPSVALLAQQLVHDLCALGLPTSVPEPAQTEAAPAQTDAAPAQTDAAPAQTDPEEQFRFSLRCLIDGLRQLLPAGGGNRPASPEGQPRPTPNPAGNGAPDATGVSAPARAAAEIEVQPRTRPKKPETKADKGGTKSERKLKKGSKSKHS